MNYENFTKVELISIIRQQKSEMEMDHKAIRKLLELNKLYEHKLLMNNIDISELTGDTNIEEERLSSEYRVKKNN